MRGFGTALQTLAGAFGSGATSYGTTGIEAQKIAEDTRRNDRDFKEKQRQFDVGNVTANQRIKATESAAMARLRAMMTGGLTQQNMAKIQLLMQQNPGMTMQEAMLRVLNLDDDESDGWDNSPLVPTAPRPGQPAPAPAPVPAPLRSGPTIGRPR